MRLSDQRYVLRIWHDGAEADAWRATLRDLRSGDERSFVSVDQLSEYLLQQGPLDANAAPAEDP